MQFVKLFARRLSTWLFPLSILTYKRYSSDLRKALKQRDEKIDRLREIITNLSRENK